VWPARDFIFLKFQRFVLELFKKILPNKPDDIISSMHRGWGVVICKFVVILLPNSLKNVLSLSQTSPYIAWKDFIDLVFR